MTSDLTFFLLGALTIEIALFIVLIIFWVIARD